MTTLGTLSTYRYDIRTFSFQISYPSALSPCNPLQSEQSGSDLSNVLQKSLRSSQIGISEEASSLMGSCWRRGPGSNRRIKVLQTSPLPLGYRASLGLRFHAHPDR